MEVPLSTVRNKLHRAKKKMRDTVKRKEAIFMKCLRTDKLSQYVDDLLTKRVRGY